jgi:hypothetical protein
MTAIRHYFPTFNTDEFCGWLESSFLPHFLSLYISGRTRALKLVAEETIIQERSIQVSEIVAEKRIIRSRFLSVDGIEIVDWDFKAGTPVVNLKCFCDRTDHIATEGGEDVIGGPECIRRTEYLLSMGINRNEGLPVWKAVELHVGSETSRL